MPARRLTALVATVALAAVLVPVPGAPGGARAPTVRGPTGQEFLRAGVLLPTDPVYRRC